MKNILAIFISLLTTHCNVRQTEKIDYIEIKHLGVEQKFIKPLFISTKNVEIKITGNYVQVNNQKPELLTIRDSMILSNSDYSVLLIDSSTFRRVVDFINQNHNLFSNATKKIHGDDIDYAIIVNGNVFYISYKQKNSFFSGLISFLKSERCKKDNISAISSYFDTFP